MVISATVKDKLKHKLMMLETTDGYTSGDMGETPLLINLIWEQLQNILKIPPSSHPDSPPKNNKVS